MNAAAQVWHEWSQTQVVAVGTKQIGKREISLAKAIGLALLIDYGR